MALTPKRERFCAEYVVDLNATAAARRAGFSARTANAEGPNLLTLPEVQARVNELQAERSQEIRLSADKALLALQAIIDMNPDEVEKLRYADKLKAIELALRHLGMLQPDTALAVQLNVNAGLPTEQAPAHVIERIERLLDGEPPLEAIAERVEDEDAALLPTASPESADDATDEQDDL